MIGQDEMVDLLVGTAVNGTKRTFGGLSINGCFQMNDESGDVAMTDTWTIFGDPSLLVRTDDPTEMTITHNDVIIIGESEFAINCDLDNALACISRNGEIIGTATVTGGVANVPLADVTPGETLTIAVTGFNKVTYLTDIIVIAPSGPYLVVDYISIDGETSVDYGQTKNIDLCLKNVGPETASSVTATMTTTDEYVVSFTNNVDVSFGDITGDNGTATSSNSFTLTLADNVPDQHVVSFDVVINDSSKETWNGTISLTANAPVFEVAGMILTNDDDGNGRLDPGETAELIFTTSNVGHANSNIFTAAVTGDSPYMDIETSSLLLTLEAGASAEVIYNVSANEVTAQGTVVNLDYNVTQDVYTANFNDVLVIGQAPEVNIGTGTQQSSNYPFYTYYENNKTQMLYLADDIGAGEKLIQEIALDFSVIGSETTVNNLEILFLETDATGLASSYEDVTNATQVFYQSGAYTMPTETGWHTFDIEDFTYSGASNLLVQISWGDDGQWSSPAYSLNCTTASYSAVAFGYADSETPPNYDGSSSDLPNIIFYIEGEASGDEHPVTFTVEDGSGNALSDAVVIVGVQNNQVDDNGQTSFTLIEGDYTYMAYAPDYSTVSNSFTVAGEEDITIVLAYGSVNEIAENIKIYPNPSNGTFVVSAPELDTEMNVKIFNIAGALMYDNTTANDLLNIDMSDKAKGLYLIRITSGESVYNSKIIIK